MNNNLFFFNNKNENIFKDLLENEILEDEILEDDIFKDFLKDEVLENEVLQNEILEDKILEDEVLKDKILKDEILKDETFKDEVLEDEIFKYENKNFKDEIMNNTFLDYKENNIFKNHNINLINNPIIKIESNILKISIPKIKLINNYPSSYSLLTKKKEQKKKLIENIIKKFENNEEIINILKIYQKNYNELKKIDFDKIECMTSETEEELSKIKELNILERLYYFIESRKIKYEHNKNYKKKLKEKNKKINYF